LEGLAVRRLLLVISAVPVLAVGLYSLWEYLRLNFGINLDYMEKLGIHSTGPFTAFVNWLFRYTFRLQGLIVQAITFFVPLIGVAGGFSGFLAIGELWSDPGKHTPGKFYRTSFLAILLAFVGYWIVVFSSWLTNTIALYMIGILRV
jgi:hypothetical protein